MVEVWCDSTFWGLSSLLAPSIGEGPHILYIGTQLQCQGSGANSLNTTIFHQNDLNDKAIHTLHRHYIVSLLMGKTMMKILLELCVTLWWFVCYYLYNKIQVMNPRWNLLLT